MINRSYHFKIDRYVNGDFQGSSFRVVNLNTLLPPNIVPEVKRLLTEFQEQFPNEDIIFISANKI